MRILIIIGILTLGTVLMSWVVANEIALSVMLVSSVAIAIFYLNKIELFWKVYAYFFALLAIISCVGFLFDDYSVVDYLSIPVTIISSLGVFLFAFRKPLWNRAIWGLIFFVSCVFLFLQREEFLITEHDIAEWGFIGTALYIMLLELFMAPQYLALLKYFFYFDDILAESRQQSLDEKPST